MKKNVIILICVLGIVACEKDYKTPVSKINFGGITSTSIYNELMSKPDTTDWKFDDNWSEMENSLFGSTLSKSNKKTDAEISLYPNPFSHIGNLIFHNIMKNNTLKIKLVDENYNVIYSKDTVISDVCIKPIRIEPNYSVKDNSDTLRLYYILIDSLNNKHFGHGDIVIFKN